MALKEWKKELMTARKLVLSKLGKAGRFTVKNHKSESGTCTICRSMKGRHNTAGGAVPPYHPNCKCTV